jgi:UDP-N-acetylglucosamine--N-acetylmuramyl-(pentapeptide) pyrophosphoryl-undecaprenol N-acetylglucosamine transferase
MTCAELTAVGLPAVYVPLPHGNGEQRLNAAPIEEAGGGLIVDDASLSPDWIRDTLIPVLLDPELVAAMSRAAARAGRRDADDLLAAAVIGVMQGGQRRARGQRHGGTPRRGAAPGHGGSRRGGHRSR